MCQISDLLFDVRFPTCQFYLLNCEVSRAPNFQKVLQTSQEFCNKNIPVVFKASTNNGGLQGGSDLFWLMTFATYKIDSLTSQWKVFDFFNIYFVKKFDFPEFHVLK